MSHLAFLIWIINITVDTIGHIALKSVAITEHENELGRWKMMLGSKKLWVGISCFCIEFIIWLVFLSLIPLSQAVLLGAINMVSIVIAGRLIFSDRLDAMRIIGVVLIGVGVIFVGLYS